MGTTSQTALRQAFLEAIDDYYGSLVVDSGAAAGATLVDAALKAWDDGNDNYFNNWWVKITGGTYSGNERLVSTYTQSAGTITPRIAFGGQLLAGDTYEIMPYEPAKIRTALNKARELCYPWLYKRVVDEAANVTGNWLWNSHFEDYTSGAFDHMALSGAPTMTQEATTIRGAKGTKAAKFAGGAGSSYMYQSHVENPSLLDLTGKTVTFYGWGWASAANKAKLEIYSKTQDGTTATTASSFHTGGSEYELLSVNVTLPSNMAEVQFRWYNTGATCYWDNSYVLGPNLYRLHLPKAFAHAPDAVYLQVYSTADDVDGQAVWSAVGTRAWRIEDDGTDRFLVFETPDARLSTLSRVTTTIGGSFIPVVSRRKIKLVGRELLSSLSSTETDTMEIANEEITPLISMALSVFFGNMVGKATSEDTTRYAGLASDFRNKAMQELQSLMSMKAPLNRIQRF